MYTDSDTDGRTQGHGIYAHIASHGKITCTFNKVIISAEEGFVVGDVAAYIARCRVVKM